MTQENQSKKPKKAKFSTGVLVKIKETGEVGRIEVRSELTPGCYFVKVNENTWMLFRQGK